jgi:ElaB/YqjD/DUF883 family membrane-anchored ribosome-binding protein
MTTIVKENHDIANDEDFKDDLHHLKEDMATLRKDLQSAFGSIKGLAASKAGNSVEKGKELAHDAEDRLKSVRADLQSQIREKPMTAVGVAFGAGLLIALLGRK